MIPKSHVCFVHFTPSTENLTLCLKQNTKLSINNGENPSDSESLHWVFPKLSWSVLERETLTKCNIKVKKLVTWWGIQVPWKTLVFAYPFWLLIPSQDLCSLFWLDVFLSTLPTQTALTWASLSLGVQAVLYYWGMARVSDRTKPTQRLERN